MYYGTRIKVRPAGAPIKPAEMTEIVRTRIRAEVSGLVYLDTDGAWISLGTSESPEAAHRATERRARIMERLRSNQRLGKKGKGR